MGIFGDAISKPSLVIRFGDYMVILAKKHDLLSVRSCPAVRGKSGRKYEFGLKQGYVGLLASYDQKFKKIAKRNLKIF